ncbi:MAG: hypothetical protein QNJ23_01570 [Woeseiaceae bacterium]|nr:hypothetical protein [Woeseiaceae bacterium]
MKIKMIITALLLSLSLTAAAQFKTIAEAYEVRISDVRLPQSEVGTIGFKECDDCDYQTRRVSEGTVYEFNGQRMSLEKFRRALAGVDRSQNIPVQVLHHLESNQVTKVWILIP